jgi:hypothetical protein
VIREIFESSLYSSTLKITHFCEREWLLPWKMVNFVFGNQLHVNFTSILHASILDNRKYVMKRRSERDFFSTRVITFHVSRFIALLCIILTAHHRCEVPHSIAVSTPTIMNVFSRKASHFCIHKESLVRCVCFPRISRSCRQRRKNVFLSLFLSFLFSHSVAVWTLSISDVCSATYNRRIKNIFSGFFASIRGVKRERACCSPITWQEVDCHLRFFIELPLESSPLSSLFRRDQKPALETDQRKKYLECS